MAPIIISQCSFVTNAQPAAIWAQYAHPNLWSKWDKDVVYAKMLDGEFCQGAQGILKPAGGPTVTFTLTEVVPGTSFTTSSTLPFAHMIFYHALEQLKDNTVKITHRVEMTGLTAPIFAFLLGKKIKAGLPSALKKLAALATSNTVTN